MRYLKPEYRYLVTVFPGHKISRRILCHFLVLPGYEFLSRSRLLYCFLPYLMFSFNVRLNSLDVRSLLRNVRNNQFISTGDLYKLSLDGACRERKFSVQSRSQCYEMSDIAIATAPLTLHQTMLNKTNKLNGKDKSDVS